MFFEHSYHFISNNLGIIQNMEKKVSRLFPLLEVPIPVDLVMVKSKGETGLRENRSIRRLDGSQSGEFENQMR